MVIFFLKFVTLLVDIQGANYLGDQTPLKNLRNSFKKPIPLIHTLDI